jgi:hypothetical protein
MGGSWLGNVIPGKVIPGKFKAGTVNPGTGNELFERPCGGVKDFNRTEPVPPT